MTAIPTEGATTSMKEKSSKGALIAGAVILGLLILAAGTGAIVYYVRKNDEPPIVDDDAVLVIDQETAVEAPDIMWPECQAQLFVNQTAKELYSIDVRVNDKKNYGPMHVELYDNETGVLIAKSSTKDGQGWTTFNFSTRPKLLAPQYVYIFIIVPEDGQTVSIWYNDDARIEQTERFLYNYITKEILDGPGGSSLTFKLYATQYN